MQRYFRQMTCFLALFAAICFASNTALAKEDAQCKRLHIPTTVKGFVGGESHDCYVVRGRKGRVMTVKISWRHKGNTGGFMMRDSPDFFNASDVSFGKTSDSGKRWTGSIPKSLDYYIFVVAHPDDHYSLKVTEQ